MVNNQPLKDTLKTTFANISSSVNLISMTAAEVQALKTLIQVWPSLSTQERIGHSTLFTVSVLAQIYPTYMFGHEENIIANTTLTLFGLGLANAVTIPNEEAANNQVVPRHPLYRFLI